MRLIVLSKSKQSTIIVVLLVMMFIGVDYVTQHINVDGKQILLYIWDISRYSTTSLFEYSKNIFKLYSEDAKVSQGQDYLHIKCTVHVS